MSVTAILTAGGIGSRMKNNIPKQFLTVNEIPIIIYTLQKFQNNKSVNNIVVACLEEWQPMLRAYSKEFNISKLTKIVNGGETGIESIKNAFSEVDDDVVLIHDGNRPLVDDKIIDKNIEVAKKIGATTTYINIHDGIIKVDADLHIKDASLDRAKIKMTQTPHTFTREVLLEVFSKIKDPNKYISLADAAAKIGHEVALVEGSEINFKITTQNDLSMFESITNTRFGNV